MVDSATTTVLDWRSQAIAIDGSPTSYLALGRQLAAFIRSDAPTHADRTAQVRIALLASHTLDMLVPALTVEAARREMLLDVRVMPFGQLETLASAATSELYQVAPDVIVVANLVDETAVFGDRFGSLSTVDIECELAQAIERTAALLQQLRRHSNAQLVVWNQLPPARLVNGSADAWLATSQMAVRARLNAQLAEIVRATSGASIFDVARVAVNVGLHGLLDQRMSLMARQPFSTAGNLAIASALARHVVARRRPTRKCIVVDLDNTLWGGVIGEDGVGGIRLGDEFPGNAYKALQRALLGMRNRGYLLAIASKNNVADVREVFDSHSDMLLRWDDFAAHEIHWHDKASSMRAIAANLQIGIDSLIFLDDNPIERAWVREQTPEVLVVELPKEPYRYVAALDAVEQLDQWMLTEEDLQRPAQYRSELQRGELRDQVGSVDDFLQALQIKATVGLIDASTENRVVQLLGKTNQFNVTTRRHTDAELRGLLAMPGAFGYWMRVSDRYGDHGLVAVAIVVPHQGTAYRIDTLLMSCRVLGRRIEGALLAAVAQRVRSQGGTDLLGEFIPTKKNAPAKDLFADAKFALRTDGWWQLVLDESAVAVPAFVELVVQSPGND